MTLHVIVGSRGHEARPPSVRSFVRSAVDVLQTHGCGFPDWREAGGCLRHAGRRDAADTPPMPVGAAPPWGRPPLGPQLTALGGVRTRSSRRTTPQAADYKKLKRARVGHGHGPSDSLSGESNQSPAHHYAKGVLLVSATGDEKHNFLVRYHPSTVSPIYDRHRAVDRTSKAHSAARMAPQPSLDRWSTSARPRRLCVSYLM
jgi:hypothetical protein